MSEHHKASPLRFRAWMAVNGVLLLALTAWILKPDSAGTDMPLSDVAAQVDESSLAGVPIPTKQTLMAKPGPHFGLSAPQVPFSGTEIDRLSTAAGARPTILQFFVKWNEELRTDAIFQSYKRKALPVITWEPWEGMAAGINQPKYALSTIAAGTHDAYITRFATAIRDQRYPVALRFGHEMNGHWYPWSESRSGNKRGDYVKAWRHVRSVFDAVGATNVIWVWSPNVLRSVQKVSLKALYPGDDQVDWLAVVGYAIREKTAAAVFEPTFTAFGKFADKPILIAETGVQPGAGKPAWIKDFFSWLPTQKNLVGFIWFEFSKLQGGSADWRFTADPVSVQAFHDGIAKVTLAPPPTSP